MVADQAVAVSVARLGAIATVADAPVSCTVIPTDLIAVISTKPITA